LRKITRICRRLYDMAYDIVEFGVEGFELEAMARTEVKHAA
jgi:hypothetical protein